MPAAIALIRAFADAGKPVAAICHGPWLLVEADLLRGRRATSWPSIRTDLRNAGANVVDEPAVTDGNIVTSRKPDDVEAFTDAVIGLHRECAGGREESGAGARLTDLQPLAAIRGRHGRATKRSDRGRRRFRSCGTVRRGDGARPVLVETLRMLTLRSEAQSPSPGAFTACVRLSRNRSSLRCAPSRRRPSSLPDRASWS